MPIAGIQDIRRDYVRDEAPVVLGLLAVGDSSAATNPSLGRGAAIGAIQASVLRDALAENHADLRELAMAYHQACQESVAPWIDGALRFDRHRLAEMRAEADGTPYAPEDQSWTMTTALLKGAGADPVLARASSRIGAMLASPPEVFAEPAVQQRIGPFIAAPRYPAGVPTREGLLQVLAEARNGVKTPALRAS